MKKNLIWTLAALFVGGLALTSCDVSDNPNPNPVLPSDPEDLFNKTSTVIDFEDDQTPFVADSRITVGVAENADWGSKVATFVGAGNAQNGYSFAHYDFSEKVQKATISVVSFDYYNANSRAIVTVGDALVRTNGAGAGCGKTSYGAKGAIFRIGSDKNNFFINGTTLGGVADWTGKWLKVEVKVYNFDRQVQWSVKDQEGTVLAESGVTEGEGEETVFTPGKEDYWQADANEGTQIDVFGYINNGQNCYIDNLSITNSMDPSVKFADAKVIYVDPDGKEIKEAREVKEVRVGSTVNLLESDKEAIHVDADGAIVTSYYNYAGSTIKWVYDSDNAAETTVAEEGTVVTIKFKDSGKYAYRLRTYFNDGQGANGTKAGDFIDGEQFVGDTKTVGYKIAYKHPTDGKWYVAPKVDTYEGRTYTFTGNEALNAAGTIHLMDVKYEKVDSIVWIGEFEDKTAMTLVGEVETWIGWTEAKFWPKGQNGDYNASDYFSRFSNGQAARLTDGSYFIINDAFEAGEYKIYIFGRSGGSEAMAPTLYYIPAEGGDPVKIEKEVPTIATTTGGITIENVQLPAGAKLVVKNDGTTGLDLDLISICKQPAAVAE